LSTAFYVPSCPALISEPPQDIISALAGRNLGGCVFPSLHGAT
jgi:hypothetical protein